MRSSEILTDIWPQFRSCIFLSGTLSPIESFADTAGVSNFKGREFSSTFDFSKIRSFIATDLSTQGIRLEESMKNAYARSIESFLSTKQANTAIFFSSYRIQNDLIDNIRDVATSLGRKIFIESPRMKGSDGRRVLDGFSGCANHGDGILCASMQGRFAEGADFPGRQLERVFIAGVPFDRMNTKTKLLVDYSKTMYGNEKGTLYSYILPAVRRASQSLGRALRSKEDSADFVLGDVRYRRFLEMLPDYIVETAVTASARYIGKFFSDSIEEELQGPQEALQA